MRIIRYAALLLASLAATDAAAQCADRRVQAELAEMRGELQGASLDCTVAARGDLDGDGARDAVLLLSYEGMGGGNNWGSFLYVLLADRSAPLLEEPEAERGPIDSVTVAGREVRVRTLEYRDGDGRCCPSGRDAFALRVEERRLVRVPVRGW
ncbi:hypothetical protein [Longimicrobium sp.]|uniref:hypothetical protein n=1 Tax=Longimicrobium sp. TaxID=2029185 RepID=UPI002E2FE75E|nr:hypothetical protein [Longimicrobium sp.]HEX6042451.1 hypothetical protein [Longimicrobium sp.]